MGKGTRKIKKYRINTLAQNKLHVQLAEYQELNKATAYSVKDFLHALTSCEGSSALSCTKKIKFDGQINVHVSKGLFC